MATIVRKRQRTSKGAQQCSLVLKKNDIIVTRFLRQKDESPAISSSNNRGIHVHVTGSRSGVPQAKLDINSISTKLGMINLEDLEYISKNIQFIVRSLKLKRGQYALSVDGEGVKSAFDQLKCADMGANGESLGSDSSAAYQSREEVIRAELNDVYSPAEAEELMCISRQALQKKRRVHTIIGLKVANRYLYPKWQFDESGQVIEGLAPILRNLFSAEKNTLEVIARLNDRRPFLEGRSIKDCLIEGSIEDAEMASEGLASTRQ